MYDISYEIEKKGSLTPYEIYKRNLKGILTLHKYLLEESVRTISLSGWTTLHLYGQIALGK